MIAWGLLDTDHPVLAHLIPIRRCNLSCTYCNEFDDFSKPVPIEEMLRRIDRLAELGTTIITQSGGEPLLHPDLDRIIARVRSHGILAGMITNGYLLTRERIERGARAPAKTHAPQPGSMRPGENARSPAGERHAPQAVGRRSDWAALQSTRALSALETAPRRPAQRADRKSAKPTSCVSVRASDGLAGSNPGPEPLRRSLLPISARGGAAACARAGLQQCGKP